jgi:hypothetical protein
LSETPETAHDYAMKRLCPIDAQAQFIDGEGIVWRGGENGADRPFDPTWPSAHKCWVIISLAD